MKIKIIICYFFTIIMLILPLSSIAGQVNYQEKKLLKNINPIEIKSNPVDLPEWKVGNFWEYDFSINIAGIAIFEVTRMNVLLTSDTGDEYTLNLSGYLDKLIFNHLDWSSIVKAAYIEGNAHIDKSTLSIKDYSFIVLANIHTPFKIEIKINLKMEFDKALEFMIFPIDKGKTWTINTNVDFYIDGYIRESGEDLFTIDEESLENPILDLLKVLSEEIISVEAGSFNSYLISGGMGNPSEIWYSPEIGFLAKVDQFIPMFFTIYIPIDFGCNLELTSTNYNYPENNAPAIPEIHGLNNGNVKDEYKCSVKTTDPNGEQIYYMIDWGDGISSGWQGPYDSSEEVFLKHSFPDQAAFNIRVKAKDTNEYQTAWSDYFSVIMPRSRQNFNLLFFKFFESRPYLFPLFLLLILRFAK